ncbi:unnamed protein product, partial [Chrysoparadoxa australica]
MKRGRDDQDGTPGKKRGRPKLLSVPQEDRIDLDEGRDHYVIGVNGGRLPPLPPCPVTEADMTLLARSVAENTALGSLQAMKAEVVERLHANTGGRDRPNIVGKAVAENDSHWDFLLKEMMWMSEDFRKERKRHEGRSKKIAKSVDLYFKGREAREARKEREEAAAVKRLANRVARDVRLFWGKLNKVISYKQKVEVDEARRKAMDKHLVYLVKQTERYTTMLADNMQGAGGATSLLEGELEKYGHGKELLATQAPVKADPSPAEVPEAEVNAKAEPVAAPDAQEVGKPQLPPPSAGPTSNGVKTEEFVQIGEEEDDETTLDIEDKLGGAMAAEEELDVLAADADLSLEEILRREYAAGSGPAGEELEYISEDGNMWSEELPEDEEEEEEELEEYLPLGDEKDDEATMEAEEFEAQQAGEDGEGELDELAADADLSVEEMMRRYYTGTADMDEQSIGSEVDEMSVG